VDAKEAWKDYQKIAKDEFNDLRVNKTHNPMFSDDGILAVIARENRKRSNQGTICFSSSISVSSKSRPFSVSLFRQ